MSRKAALDFENFDGRHTTLFPNELRSTMTDPAHLVRKAEPTEHLRLAARHAG